jgi:hypothetical protein
MVGRMSCWFCLCAVLATSAVAPGAPLAPDDASIQENLCLWLRSPDVYFDPAAGTWTDLSGKGHDAETVGEVAAWGVTYIAPTLSFGANPQVFRHNFSTVKFAGSVDDLMRATGLNGGVGMTDLTIVTVYKLYNVDQSGGDITRPLGVGSVSGEGVNMGNNFNLAIDVTIRKDNGNVGGATATHPVDQFFIRAARMTPANIDQWFNTDGTFTQVHNRGGASYTTSTDNFYLGDLRAGLSPTTGTAYSRTDIEIAEVVVYNTALTDAQIEGISQWLQANVRVERKTAFAPSPADGALVETTFLTLGWMPGALAAAHQVYLGESLESVGSGATQAFSATDAALLAGLPGGPYSTGLVPGTTYYWRVDEVNDASADSPWTGDVWSFHLRPATASNPSPADGVQFVHPDQDLRWEKGLGNLFHTIYFGTSFDEVDQATTGGMMTIDPTNDPGPLELGKTYFWRVDEFDGLKTYKGSVWSFTTLPEVAVTDTSLAGWWKLDERQGTTAVDWSGHNHHGVLYGNAQWTDGYHGSALTFADDVYVEMTGYPGVTGTDARTCCAWIRTTKTNTEIFSWGQNVAGQKWIVRVDTTGGLRVEVNGGYTYGATYIADDQWHHVAVVFENDGSPDVVDAQLYVDGQLDTVAASQAAALDTAATGTVRLGESPWHNTPFIGQIDDARIYDKVLTEDEIQRVLRSDPLLAADPEPGRGAIVDVRDVDSLRWTAGDTAASHDVYLGQDRAAVAAATKESPEYQGNQTRTGLALTGLVEFGGGDYYWRVDEVEADGTVRPGDVWVFTVPAYLLVDDFESYTDQESSEIFSTWIDGYTNGLTGSVVGYLQAVNGTFGETQIVHGGRQSMPLDYNNVNAPWYSEVERTWDTPQDWTVQGVTALTLLVRGRSGNDAANLYVALEDNAGKVAVVSYPDPRIALTTKWTEWSIPLADFAGVNAAAIKKIYIGLGDRQASAPGGAGRVYIDDIRMTKLAPESMN